MVTKGFRPLTQDALYRLSDTEEDEDNGERSFSVPEKGVAERGKEGRDEEEEEGGITFKVRCSSTPDERKDGKLSVSTLPVSPLSPNMLSSPPTTPSNVQSDLCLVPGSTSTENQSSECIPGASAAVQSNDKGTVAPSSGKLSFCKNCL